MSPEHRLSRSIQNLYNEVAKENFWNTALGGDLWIDGRFAIQTLLKNQILISKFTKKYNITTLSTCSLGLHLSYLDKEIGKSVKNPDQWWSYVGIGIGILWATGGPPSLERSKSLIILNDTVMHILSPSYRAIRFLSFNQGVEIVSEGFEPGLRRFSIADRNLISKRLNLVQFYNINHDSMHCLFFERIYSTRFLGENNSIYATMMAEATCIAYDAVIYSELAIHRKELKVLSEYEAITNDKQKKFFSRNASSHLGALSSAASLRQAVSDSYPHECILKKVFEAKFRKSDKKNREVEKWISSKNFDLYYKYAKNHSKSMRTKMRIDKVFKQLLTIYKWDLTINNKPNLSPNLIVRRKALLSSCKGE